MVKVANLKKKLVSMGSAWQMAGSAKKDRPVQLWITYISYDFSVIIYVLVN